MKKLAGALASATLLTLLAGFFTYLKTSRVEGALATGSLAPLPVGALAVQVDTEGNLFSRTFWVSFKASAPAIKQWVSQSPALVKTRPGACRQSVLAGEQPTWFRPASIRKGLVYQISTNGEANYGTVWIDQETSVVYIKTSHS